MTFRTGDKVRAKIDMLNDLTEDGLGVSLCANKGDLLIVRKLNGQWIHVSHEHVLDRTFCVTADEIELMP